MIWEVIFIPLLFIPTLVLMALCDLPARFRRSSRKGKGEGEGTARRKQQQQRRRV
ncbi:hypothetical protein M430DRAFT_35259 [Amorphotheca resinae ATCC 22711]|uniref:Uncharacterized protein n=1 Tax=Amorphotheca resinae ATCC 22711 TaxID=857342 RepID=A0A2T3B2S0_AMORE|nr:hypothetical protein M430DRAFT_35259 [Amorphotheca resinae ATCC 22711]PSS18862.1 hypothetical protein M430DRAFT_35259 [Amorphotheca resinae ATCC 22711]